ncbi:hypothetical protein BGZ94_000453 [Podila epigama]|nr:hypothetical protein BGZ94_000453 [Podila epigama]
MNSAMTNTTNQDTANIEEKTTCRFSPLHVLQNWTFSEMKIAEGWQSVAFPTWVDLKPVLRCEHCDKIFNDRRSFLQQHVYSMSCSMFHTAEGKILAASLVQDNKFGAAASELLKTSTAVADKSDTTEDGEVLGPASPKLQSALTKRLQTSAEVTVSHTATGTVGIDIRLNFTGRELGLQDVPFHGTTDEGLMELLSNSSFQRMLSGTSWIEFPRDHRLPQEYPHAKVCKITHDKNDERLVIGFKAFNILVTEIWVLDKSCSTERAFTASSCSGGFRTQDNEDIKIFIDKRSYDLAVDIVSGDHVPRFSIDHLRQVRSHMCTTDTYRMGRASSFYIANMVSAQPATIFTLAIIYPASGDAFMASSLLSRIAKEVNRRGRNARLERVWVENTLSHLKDRNKSVGVYLGRLLDFFQDREDINDQKRSELEIIINSLAESVSSMLYRCNEKVVIPHLTTEMESQSW